MVETPDVASTPAPSTPGKNTFPGGDKQIALIMAGVFVLGGLVGIRLARMFVVPPLPRAAKPCADCEKKRAEELAQRAADGINNALRDRAEHVVANGDSSVPDDEPEEEQFDQTQVVAPTKVFSPVGSPQS